MPTYGKGCFSSSFQCQQQNRTVLDQNKKPATSITAEMSDALQSFPLAASRIAYGPRMTRPRLPSRRLGAYVIGLTCLVICGRQPPKLTTFAIRSRVAWARKCAASSLYLCAFCTIACTASVLRETGGAGLIPCRLRPCYGLRAKSGRARRASDRFAQPSQPQLLEFGTLLANFA